MTDNEIIKALELCFAPDGMACSKCPYHKFGKLCKVERSKDALDLINRQKEENTELQYENLAMVKRNRELNEELAKKSNKLSEILPIVAEMKNEAIKEFAERLCEGRVSNDPVVIAVKVELEEMTEDGK